MKSWIDTEYNDSHQPAPWRGLVERYDPITGKLVIVAKTEQYTTASQARNAALHLARQLKLDVTNE